MPRMIDVQLAELHSTAVLHDDAPSVTELLWDALPVSGELRHLRWGGEAGYLLSTAVARQDLPAERRVSMYGRGQLLLRPEHGEIIIGYGQGQARDGISRGSEAYHVASFVTNVAALLDRVALTRRTGKVPVMISRAE